MEKARKMVVLASVEVEIASVFIPDLIRGVALTHWGREVRKTCVLQKFNVPVKLHSFSFVFSFLLKIQA